jgi:hypothetical protein
MRSGVTRFVAVILPAVMLGAAVLATLPAAAHHSIVSKFDENQPTTLNGIVTYVDWRNPHVHVFVNVTNGTQTQNWAVEFPSKIDLQKSGWNSDSVPPGTHVAVEGIRARDGSRQVWGNRMTVEGTALTLLTLDDLVPVKPLISRPAPRWPDGRPMLGTADGSRQGYWGFPTQSALVEEGSNVAMTPEGLLASIDDAGEVAPLQPWALELFKLRQSRFLQDDPQFLNCKPPGGPRQFLSHFGAEFVEHRDTERVFVTLGSGNHNFRILYLDGRDPVGQVGGDDDNPLYYGRSVGGWQGDTLVVETSGFNEDFWISPGGLPHSNRMVLTERFTRPDHDTLIYEVTINDPGAYTRPWTASWELQWVEGELPFHLCQENRP